MLTQPNILAAYLYLRMGEQMPENAPDEWFLEPDPFAIDPLYLRRFIAMTEVLLIDLEQLELDENEPAAPQYMTLFYNAAKDVFDNDKTRLRTYFAWLYLVLFQTQDGPRWGDFVAVYGVENFVALARQRFEELI